jgi:hypothetical protein
MVLSFSPEESCGVLMDQCSGHDIPPAIGLLADRKGHDLEVRLATLVKQVLTLRRLKRPLSHSE